MTVTYKFDTSLTTNVDGKKTLEKKNLVDGTEGLSVYYLKRNDTESKRLKAVQSGSVFKVEYKNGQTEQNGELDEASFHKLLQVDQDLHFVHNYLTSKTSSVVKVESKTPQVQQSSTSSEKSTTETQKDNAEPLPKRGPKPQRKNNKKEQSAPAQA